MKIVSLYIGIGAIILIGIYMLSVRSAEPPNVLQEAPVERTR